MDYFNQLLHTLPLELFVAVGTFIEEVISPIPSVIVLVPAGAAAEAQGAGWWSLLVLAVISGIARVAGGYIVYWLADKFEDVVFGQGRTFFGYTHKDIEGFAAKVGTQRGERHIWLILFAMNALPIFPGTVISAGSGFIKVRPRTFMTATFAGSVVNGLAYLYVGYAGMQVSGLLAQADRAAQTAAAVVVVGLAIWMGWRYRARRRDMRK